MLEPSIPPECLFASLPPAYSPSTASPSYASEPHDGEQRLELVARPQPPSPQGTVTHKSRHLTVSFNEQDADASTPTFVRNSIVKGEVEIKDTHDVLAVTVTLEGKQALSVVEGGETVRVLFSETHELWRKRGSASCPTLLGFYIPFPLNYVDDQGTHPLPPSFEVQFSGVPGLRALNAYSVSVVVTRPRLASWKKQQSIHVPVKYHPRSRPYRPIARPLHPFLSTVKTVPEEWHQVTSSLPNRDGTASGVDSNLFIPAVQIYALSDTIPFHLQLRGPAQSLRTFMGGVSDAFDVPRRVTTRNSDASSISFTPSYVSWAAVKNPGTLFGSVPSGLVARRQAPVPSKASVRVYLLRQVCAKVHGQKAWKNIVLGEGKLVPVERPPSWSPSASRGYGEEEHALDWEGEVRCDGDVDTASFAAGDLLVKDFIVMHFYPSDPQHSDFVNHQHAHSIRLVTDPYREAFSHPSDE